MKRRTVTIILASFVLLAVMLTSCAAGAVLSASAGPVLAELGIGYPTWAPTGAPSEEVASTFRPFWEAWNLVQSRYVDEARTQPEEMTYGAIRGMLQSLGDEGHTRFLTPEEREFHQTAISGSFAGIGATVGERDGNIVIVAPMDGSPAEAAGLQPGDIILAVDAEPTEGKSLNDVISLVRGEPDSQVTLTILHPDAQASQEVTITRQIIELPAASWTMLPNQVAYIRMNQFSANLHDTLVGILNEAQAQGAERYLVDVRNNPGGLVTQVVAVTSEFLDEGSVFIERRRGGEQEVYSVRGDPLLPDAPLVVLTNEGSASAAEIFAGALKDQERATLVGERTFGTGTVLNQYPLSDGSAILLGVAEWLTPNGELIKLNGVEPTVTVTLPPEVYPVSPDQVEGLDADALQQLDDTQFIEGYKLLTEQ